MPDLAPVNNDAILINGVEYLVSDLSFSDLRVHYFTGVSVRRLGDQRSKSSGYRNGVILFSPFLAITARIYHS